MKYIFLRLTIIVLSVFALVTTADAAGIKSGEIWPDTDGTHINAHGGGILLHNNTYYWFGEHKADNTSSALVGVMCYSSPDLQTWTCHGPALQVTDETGHDIERGCVLERPKVKIGRAHV